MDEKYFLELTQEEGILLLTSARLLDKLVAGVTIHAKERDELIRDIIEKLVDVVSPGMASMSEELADAIVDSVFGVDELDEEELAQIALDASYEPSYLQDRCDTSDFVIDLEAPSHIPAHYITSSEAQVTNFPMYSIDKTLPALEKALVAHYAVRVQYYSFARESVDSIMLNPLKIVKDNGIWRMVAYCHERRDHLVFRVDRIKELAETTKNFEAPGNLSQLQENRLAAYC